MEKEDYEKRKSNLLYIFLGVAVLALLFVAGSGIWIHNISNADNTSRGTFGDMFGMANSIFSGLAFAGIIYTILLQGIELEMQREEISQSTGELKGQKNALNRQNFENKFFQLINLHHQIVNAINENWLHSSKPNYMKGREIFGNAAIRIEGVYQNRHATRHSHPRETGIERLVSVYHNDIYIVHSAVFGHYFRNLFQIVKFIDETKELDYIEKEEDSEVRYKYIRILRAQLSSYEILLLAYNGLTEYGEEFKTYINDYKLLKNMDPHGHVVKPTILLEHYPHLKEAFN